MEVISESKARPRVLLAVLVALVASCVVAGGQTPPPPAIASKAEALKVLRDCNRGKATRPCTDEAAEYLVRLFEQGDTSVLRPLLDTWKHSDGALSALLGVFYGDVLHKQQRLFLVELARRPRKERYRLAYMAGWGDGGGMRKDQLSEVRQSLLNVAARRRDHLAPVARTCLKALNTAEFHAHQIPHPKPANPRRDRP